MTIVTFYSYKGGVGRSMTLANVATYLARRGHRILVVDWDLEAPGLEEYFVNTRMKTKGRGLLQMLIERGDIKDYLWKVSFLDKPALGLDLLSSGRDEEQYYHNLERFNQEDFFAKDGGSYLETLRKQWLEEYDFVLLDSRTGLSDASGICTIFMPDIVVGLFTATLQSVRGTRDVLQLARRSRQRLDYDRSQFAVIPVPCRMDESNTEASEEWIKVFDETIGTFFDDWRPSTLPSAQILKQLAIPQSVDLAFGTNIIDWNQRRYQSAPAALAIERISRLIESRLSDITSLATGTTLDGGAVVIEEVSAGITSSLDREARLIWDGWLQTFRRWYESIWPFSKRDLKRADKQPTQDGVGLFPSPPVLPQQRKEPSVYLSFSRGGKESEWIETLFLPAVEELLQEVHYPVRFIRDFAEISAGDRFGDHIEEQLASADLMLAFITHRYLESSWAKVELGYCLDHGEESRKPVLPIMLEETDLNDANYGRLGRLHSQDMREHYGVSSSLGRYQGSSAGRDFQESVGIVADWIISKSA